MITASLTIDTDILDAINDAARKAPGLTATAYGRQITRQKSALLKKLRTEPGSPKYPIRWTSERQRRFVMAKLKREGNLPYRRTGGLVNAWDVSFDGATGEVSVTNPVPSAVYVVGEMQQAMHKDTGWYSYQDVLADAVVLAEEILIQTWFTLADPTAGVS